MVVDFHTHVFPLSPNSTVEKDLEFYFKGTERTPVEKFVILPSPDPEMVIGRTFEELYPLLKDRENVYLMATLKVSGNPKLEEDVERVKELLKNPKVVGVKLYPGYDHFFPADERLHGLYRYLERRRIPVLFHSGETYEVIKHSNPRYSHPLNFYKLAELFPNLRFILAHVGYPWFRDVGELLVEADNAYTDISDTLPEKSYRFFSVNMEMVRRGILEAMSIAEDPTRFLFATDWVVGYDDFPDYAQRFWYYYSFMRTLPYTEEELEKATRSIAERLFFGWKD